jgi:hypothetical protein
LAGILVNNKENFTAMIRIFIIMMIVCGQFCSAQFNKPSKKEFLNAINDSLSSDSWRICNADSSYYKKDTLYLFKRVINSKQLVD